MPRGGWRPNAGGPKGARAPWAAPKQDGDVVRTHGMSPLDYMLAVVRDEKADPLRRDRMAAAAAPYCHAKIEPVQAGAPGKKQLAAKAAKTAGVGSEWGDDLAAPPREATN